MEVSDARVDDLRVGTVVINVKDMERGIRFWSSALGYAPREQDRDSTFVMLLDPEGERLPVSLQLTDAEAVQPARVHLDLYTTGQEQHVARLVALGATELDEWTYPPDPDFIVLRDPDGDEFCVIDLR